METFLSFVLYCNSNTFNLTFTYVIDPHELVFLDLVVTHEQDKIITKNHNKPTNGNSYLHYDSCHHPVWKKNIPKGQFNRLKRNCTRDEEYIEQSILMQKKFEEKCYPENLVNEAFSFFLKPPEATLTKKHLVNENTTRFVTTYNDCYKSVADIIKKHFKILHLDQRLAPILPATPQVTFRRARTIKNILAPSKIQKKPSGSPLDIRSYFNDRKGIFQCKKRACLTCQFITHGTDKIHLPSGKLLNIKHFVTCSTEFVVYVLRCSCGLFYVGRTIRALRARIGDHRRLIKKGCTEHSVPRHFNLCHNKDFKHLEVFVIEHIPKGTLTANERFSLLCRREVFWIHRFDCLAPKGLNEEIEVNVLI